MIADYCASAFAGALFFVWVYDIIEFPFPFNFTLL